MKHSDSKNKALTIHKAGWVIADSENIFKDGFVIVDSGIIKKVGQGRVDSDQSLVIDHGPGVIMPAFVNAHTHLELSALKGKISFENGFQNWVKALIVYRDTLGHEIIINGINDGVKELTGSGNLTVGDVSTLGLTKHILLKSHLFGVCFDEYLGNRLNKNIEEIGTRVNDDMSLSLAGHAPHTTSPEILSELKKKTREIGLPFSIHLAESEEEIQFIQSGRGAWADFLQERGIDFLNWGVGDKTPVEYLAAQGLLDENTLVVHLTFSESKDLDILSKHQVSVCLCPRSNVNLHNRLPDIPEMLEKGIKPCLGTDSLASVDTLDIVDEMAYIANAFPSISPKDIFGMATINGAESLNMIHCIGSISPGKSWAFNYKPISANNSQSLLEAVVNGDGANGL